MSMPNARERKVVAKLAQPNPHFRLGPQASGEPSSRIPCAQSRTPLKGIQ